MRFMKKILMSMLLALMFVVQPVQASSVNDGMIAEQGLHMYVVPSGKNGMENESFWVYIEMMGEKNTPYVETSWNVELEIHHLESGSIETVEDLSVSSNGVGYVLPTLKLSGLYNYKDYELTARIKDGETVLEEKKDVAADLIVEWPTLVENHWVESIRFGKEIVGKTRAVVFDWKDDALFSRMFEVSAEEKYDALILENQDGVWTLQLTDELEGEVVFRLTDEAGHTQDCVYQIKVAKEGFPAEMKIMLVILLVLVAVVVVLVFLKNYTGNKANSKSSGLLGTASGGGEEKETITVFEVRITNAKEDLQDAKEKYDKKIAEYKKLLSDSEFFLKLHGASIDAAKELESVNKLSSEWNGLESLEGSYNAVLEEINKYGASDYDKWNRDRESKAIEYDTFIRTLEEKTEELIAKEGECRKKIDDLEEEIKKIQEKFEWLQVPLGMAVSITLEKNGSIYRIFVDSCDKGFVLDEQYPLNREYHLSEQKLSILLGVETGISIASCKGKEYVLLESKGSRLMNSWGVVNRKEIEEGNVYEFEYLLDDKSKIKICIDTN